MATKKYDEDVKTYSPAKLRNAKSLAKEHFIEKQGEVSVKVLSRVAKVPQGYIRKWMRDEKWEDSLMESPGDKVILTEKTKKVLQTGAEDFGLNEQQELFCYHYMKTFNATNSAVRAGYSSTFAHQKAHTMLKNPKIKKFLAHIKEHRNGEVFVDSMRIVQEYMKIAFADMTDFVKFGPDGLRLKASEGVDGQLITKIKEGRDGISIELADKLVALQRLEKYLEVMPVSWKQTVEEEKLKLMKEKMELERQREDDKGDGQVVIIDDI